MMCPFFYFVDKLSGDSPRSYVLFCEIDFLELMLCTVVGEEGEHKYHGDTVECVKRSEYIYSIYTCGEDINQRSDHGRHNKQNSGDADNVENTIVDGTIGHVFYQKDTNFV